MDKTDLRIYVSKHCWGCQEARKIAGEIRVEFPDVQVALVERESAERWPDEIIATPAFMLDGKLVSWGNPTRERLRSLLAGAADKRQKPAV
jgi:predicted thioredoxin/glutaredoxin